MLHYPSNPGFTENALTRSYVCVTQNNKKPHGRTPEEILGACLRLFYNLLVVEENLVVVWISSAAEQPFYPDRSYK
jgi:hypothetical protein